MHVVTELECTVKGDLRLVDNIIENRQRQEDMEVENPSAPARVFGLQVEAEVGCTDEQRSALGRRVVEQREANEQVMARRSTTYDPKKLSETDHSHKDDMVRQFINGLVKAHDCDDLSQITGYVALLDDFGRSQGVPRAASILIAEGLPAGRILSPNVEQVVVSASRALGVHSVKKDFTRALDEDFADLLRGTPLAGAYIDGCSGSPASIQRMIGLVRTTPRLGKMAIAYTIVERDFTPGGKQDFTQRVLEMSDYMRCYDFEPQVGACLSRSYETPRRPNGRCVGTSFWIRR